MFDETPATDATHRLGGTQRADAATQRTETRRAKAHTAPLAASEGLY